MRSLFMKIAKKLTPWYDDETVEERHRKTAETQRQARTVIAETRTLVDSYRDASSILKGGKID